MLHAILRRSETFERIKRAFDESRRQKVIPTAGDNRKVKAFGAQASLMDDRLQDLETAPHVFRDQTPGSIGKTMTSDK